MNFFLIVIIAVSFSVSAMQPPSTQNGTEQSNKKNKLRLQDSLRDPDTGNFVHSLIMGRTIWMLTTTSATQDFSNLTTIPEKSFALGLANPVSEITPIGLTWFSKNHILFAVRARTHHPKDTLVVMRFDYPLTKKPTEYTYTISGNSDFYYKKVSLFSDQEIKKIVVKLLAKNRRTKAYQESQHEFFLTEDCLGKAGQLKTHQEYLMLKIPYGVGTAPAS